MCREKTKWRSLVGFFLILLWCWGCSTNYSSAPSGIGNAEAGQSTESVTEKGLSSDAKPQIATSLSGVQIEGRPGETVVILSGNGPFRDYMFSRVSSTRFTLDLGDISGAGGLPILPPPSHGLELVYSEPGSGGTGAKGVQLTGTMADSIGNYVVNTVGNNLAVTLYAGTPDSVAAAGGTPSGPVPSMTDARRKVRETPAPRMTEDVVVEAAPARSKRARPNAAQEPQEPLKKQYTGKPISLDLLDADLRNVLRLIADVTGSNIVIEPDVGGKVTLKVEQVPWDQVLDMVLAMNGLGMERSGNVIRVARVAKLREEVNQQNEEIKARQELIETVKDFGDITTEYLTVNYAQPGEIAAKINEVKSDKGRISIDERTNLIIYSDYPARIATARKLITRLDRATPQVMIEARLVTMSDDTRKSLGISWNLNLNDKDPLVREFEVDILQNLGTALNFNVAQIVGQTLVALDFNLSALETQNRSKVIAAPKILTLNNVKASISQGTQIPYLNQSAADAGVVSTVFKDAVVELGVTPHITPDGKVRLEIEAKQDEPDPTVSGQGDAPAIATRKIKTELMVADGCIVVIGGVMRDTQGYTLATTPGLKDIPILGRLFKQETKARQKQELLIFISPKIVQL
jgi:type IV pilus assembly protein PilQ